VESKQGNLVENLYETLIYVMRASAAKRKNIYGASVSAYEPYYEMIQVKEAFEQMNGKGYLHYTLDPDPFDVLMVDNFFMIGRVIAEKISHFYGTYQVLMAIHFDAQQYHMHFIANNIDYITGIRFDLNRQKLSELKDAINVILMKYGISPILKKDSAGKL
jgi:hypothetical protein